MNDNNISDQRFTVVVPCSEGTYIAYWLQVISGNDQNSPPTNQGTSGSKLERTSWLTFYGSQRHLESFPGDFFGVNLFTRLCSQVSGKNFGI